MSEDNPTGPEAPNTNAKLDDGTFLEERARGYERAIKLAARVASTAPEPYGELTYIHVLRQELGDPGAFAVLARPPVLAQQPTTMPLAAPIVEQAPKADKPKRGPAKPVAPKESARIKAILSGDGTVIGKNVAVLEGLRGPEKIFGILRMAREDFNQPWLTTADVYAVAQRMRLKISYGTVKGRLSDASGAHIAWKEAEGERFFQLLPDGDKALEDAIKKKQSTDAKKDAEDDQ